MLKSVWLTNLIVNSLNDPSSVLSSYYRHLSNLVGQKKVVIRLLEPDGDEYTKFLVSDKTACISGNKDDSVYDEMVDKVIKTRQMEIFSKNLYAPLYYENIAPFGVIIFLGVDSDIQIERIKDALISFSTILYSESMGSIIRSFHETAMKVENVCVDFNQGKLVNKVVKNVSLEIYDKEFTIIAGASGSGKTTLLNVMGGMLSATKGNVWWHDTLVTDMTEKERTYYRGHTVGFVFQRYNLISDLTAEENIKIAASLVDNPLPISEVLEMVGLKDKAKSYPSQLSGGEQQRVCIARALVKRASILLCDEPTGALDTENAYQIIKILKEISKKQEIPVVVITHNPNLVVLADHLITISNGQVSDDILQPFALSADDMSRI